MTRRIVLTALLLPISLVAFQQHAPARPGGDVPPAQVTGPPVDCVRILELGDSRVRDDRTIDFIRMGRKGWRNTLPQSCPGLKAANAFSFDTSLSELCNVDIITVFDSGPGPHRGASCGLGQFVPIELAK